MCVKTPGRIWYEPAEGLDEEELEQRKANGLKMLHEVGIVNGAKFHVTDDSQDVSWVFEVNHTYAFPRHRQTLPSTHSLTALTREIDNGY